MGVESPFSTLVVGIRSIAAEQIRYSYAVHLRISPDFPVPEYLLECSPPAITLQSVEPCNPNIKQLSKEALDNLKVCTSSFALLAIRLMRCLLGGSQSCQLQQLDSTC